MKGLIELTKGRNLEDKYPDFYLPPHSRASHEPTGSCKAREQLISMEVSHLVNRVGWGRLDLKRQIESRAGFNCFDIRLKAT